MLLEGRNIELPEEFRQTILDLVNEAPSNDVLTYVKDRKKWRKGFKAIEERVPTFRQALYDYFAKTDKISPDEQVFLQDAGLNQQLIIVLSVKAITYGVDDFRAYFGNQAIILALLLDEREEVVNLGKMALEDQNPLSLSKTEAEDEIRKNYALFLVQLHPLYSFDEEEDRYVKELQKEIKDLTRTIDKKEKEIEHFQHQVAEERSNRSKIELEKKEKIRARTDEVTLLRKELLQQKAERDRLQDDFDAMKEKFDLLVQRGVVSRLEDLERSWLKQPVKINEEVIRSARKTTDLLTRSQNAIEVQRRTDRHIGNRKDLQEKIVELRRMQQEVAETILNAITPQKDLPVIAGELQEEIIRLEGLLCNQKIEFSQLTLNLISLAKSATSIESLEPLQALLETLAAHNLPFHEVQTIQSAIIDSMDRFIAANGIKRKDQPNNPVYRLRKLFSTSLPSWLIIDGHNVLKSLPQFSEGSQLGHAIARRQLIESVLRFSNSHPSCKITLVFDSPDAVNEEISEQITVVFSGGGEGKKHKADDRIIEMLSWEKTQGGRRNIFLVTSDHDFATESKELGAEVVPVHHFGLFLR